MRIEMIEDVVVGRPEAAAQPVVPLPTSTVLGLGQGFLSIADLSD